MLERNRDWRIGHAYGVLLYVLSVYCVAILTLGQFVFYLLRYLEKLSLSGQVPRWANKLVDCRFTVNGLHP